MVIAWLSICSASTSWPRSLYKLPKLFIAWSYCGCRLAQDTYRTVCKWNCNDTDRSSQNMSLLYHDLNYTIVIGITFIKWCAKINNVAVFVSAASCSQGTLYHLKTWCEPLDTMHLRRFFGPNAGLGRSIRILCCCFMDYDTNLFHLFRNKTLTVNFDQHWKIMPLSCVMLPSGRAFGPWATLHNFEALFFNLALGISQYLYKVNAIILWINISTCHIRHISPIISH